MTTTEAAEELRNRRTRRKAGNQANGLDNEPDLPPYAEIALALKLAECHNDQLRFCSDWGWMHYKNGVWCRDKRLRVFGLARQLCREAAEETGRKKEVVASAKTVAGVVNLARCDERLITTVDEWDADPWLLNTPGGVVDLRTGAMRTHSPVDLMTQQTAVAPTDEPDCPLWLTFIKRIMADDADLIAFLQRWGGYCITGCTREHALVYGRGRGANGKSTLLGTLHDLLGDYAATASTDTFIAQRHPQHSTDLAGLCGKRLVVAQEVEEGRHWNEVRLKALTGGDAITARFMKQDFFTYQPAFKLSISGNSKPHLNTVDDAIRRRFNLLPFNVTIPADERDPDLRQKLMGEGPAILRWLIDGCLDWQKKGLAAPAAATAATADYLAAEDTIGQWLDERCLTDDPNATETIADLYADWAPFAKAANEPPGTKKRFGQTLQARGFASMRDTRGRRAYSGIRLLRSNYTDDPRYGS